MSEKKGVMESLGDFMTEIFDKDKDGAVSFKELLNVFPNMAVAIAFLFVDALLLVAEYRVWNFGYYVTGDPWKAAGFVLVSAVPFYLGQVFWLYPLANIIQKGIAIIFMGVSLYVSWEFGVADLTLTYDPKGVAQMLNSLTAGYIVAGLLYIVSDKTIKAHRTKREALREAAWQNDLHKIGRSILDSLRTTLEEKRSLEQEFGADEVTTAMNALKGRKPKQQQQRPPQPTATYSAETHTPTEATVSKNGRTGPS